MHTAKIQDTPKDQEHENMVAFKLDGIDPTQPPEKRNRQPLLWDDAGDGGYAFPIIDGRYQLVHAVDLAPENTSSEEDL